MFDSINSFWQKRLSGTAEEMDDGLRLKVATCVLLLEVAHADDDFSDDEQLKIDEIIARRFKLDESQAKELLSLAEDQRRQKDDLYQFSRLVNENYSRPRKLAILDLLWEVVFSDGVLEAHEDALMHKMGTLLGVRHEELMAVKVGVKKRLGRS